VPIAEGSGGIASPDLPDPDLVDELDAARPRRSPLLWVAAGVAVVAVIAIAALRGGSSDKPKPIAPPTSPISTIATPVALPPDAAIAPVAEPPANSGSGSGSSAEPAVGSGSGSAGPAPSAGSASNVAPPRPPPVKKLPVKKPVEKQKWDPNALFPTK
jgi:hypothetical protein